MRFIAALTALVLGYAPTARAQSADWVIVPTSTKQDVSWMQPAVTTMQGALSRQGIGVLSPEQAAALFEQKGSASSTKVTDTDVQEWVTRSRQAIRHLARGDYATALKELKQAQVLSRKAVDELNRVQIRSQNVLDTCLYLVRALLETGDRARAKAQVQECVRLVPQGEPNPHMHTPDVIALYKATSAPGPEQTGSLAVSSEPSGCEVRINGLGFGKTPFEIADLYPGEYQVQVECDPGRRGRVHPVSVKDGRAEVFVDVRFDRAVRTVPLLWLGYPSQQEASRRSSDAQQIAKVLRPGAVVLASVPSIDTMELEAVSGSERRSGLVRIPTSPSGPTPDVAAAAAVALINGECKDFTGPKPVTISCKTKRVDPPLVPPGEEAATGWQANRPPRGQWIAGVTLASIGSASLLTGYGLFIVRNGTESGAQGTELQKWINLRYGMIGSSMGGSAGLIAAMPLALPDRSSTPWWAWMSGGFGIGFLVASIATAVTAESTRSQAGAVACAAGSDPLVGGILTDECKKRGRQTDLAILFGATSAPLLTMPLVYLFRKDEKKRGVTLTPNLAFGPSGGWVRIEGTF